MAAVPFYIDPSHTPLIVDKRPRPQGCDYAPLPLGAYEHAARPVLAAHVGPGDLVIASFGTPLASPRSTQVTWPVNSPYVADPRPWDASCLCPDCDAVKNDDNQPVPLYGRVVLATDDGVCDVWDADDVALVIPAALLLLPALT
ncbi:hypothetical protein ACFXJO_16280 [Streptomyces lavendulae]|uniref:hypothetical protein n=1 Tax=Streptomyces lavendulae TaxID=1914 RepID=UPI00369CE1E9